MVTTSFTLIRHGETDWNRIKRIQGHTDIPLSVEGEQQAVRLGERMVREAAQARAAGRTLFDRVISSDLLRAARTAEPVAQAAGVSLERTERLRERHYGEFETHVADEIHAKYPQDYARWQSRDPSFTIPGGESMQTFYDRISSYVLTLLREHAGERLALVAHGGVLDCCYRLATGMSLAEPRAYPLLNASVNRIEFDGERWHVRAWGDVTHLEAMQAVRDESNDRPGDKGDDEANVEDTHDQVDPRVV